MSRATKPATAVQRFGRVRSKHQMPRTLSVMRRILNKSNERRARMQFEKIVPKALRTCLAIRDVSSALTVVRLAQRVELEMDHGMVLDLMDLLCRNGELGRAMDMYHNWLGSVEVTTSEDFRTDPQILQVLLEGCATELDLHAGLHTVNLLTYAAENHPDGPRDLSSVMNERSWAALVTLLSVFDTQRAMELIQRLKKEGLLTPLMVQRYLCKRILHDDPSDLTALETDLFLQYESILGDQDWVKIANALIDRGRFHSARKVFEDRPHLRMKDADSFGTHLKIRVFAMSVLIHRMQEMKDSGNDNNKDSQHQKSKEAVINQIKKLFSEVQCEWDECTLNEDWKSNERNWSLMSEAIIIDAMVSADDTRIKTVAKEMFEHVMRVSEVLIISHDRRTNEPRMLIDLHRKSAMIARMFIRHLFTEQWSLIAECLRKHQKLTVMCGKGKHSKRARISSSTHRSTVYQTLSEEMSEWQWSRDISVDLGDLQQKPRIVIELNKPDHPSKSYFDPRHFHAPIIPELGCSKVKSLKRK